MRKTREKPITAGQLKALHATLTKAGIEDDDRHDLIEQLTNGRTKSSKDLTSDEAYKLITTISGQQEKRKQDEIRKSLKAIYMLSMNISFLNKDYPNDTDEDFQLNKAKINMFARSKSKAQKNVSAMSITELQDFKKQLEAIFRKETDNETKK